MTLSNDRGALQPSQGRPRKRVHQGTRTPIPASGPDIPPSASALKRSSRRTAATHASPRGGSAPFPSVVTNWWLVGHRLRRLQSFPPPSRPSRVEGGSRTAKPPACRARPWARSLRRLEPAYARDGALTGKPARQPLPQQRRTAAREPRPRIEAPTHAATALHRKVHPGGTRPQGRKTRPGRQIIPTGSIPIPYRFHTRKTPPFQAFAGQNIRKLGSRTYRR